MFEVTVTNEHREQIVQGWISYNADMVEWQKKVRNPYYLPEDRKVFEINHTKAYNALTAYTEAIRRCLGTSGYNLITQDTAIRRIIDPSVSNNEHLASPPVVLVPSLADSFASRFTSMITDHGFDEGMAILELQISEARRLYAPIRDFFIQNHDYNDSYFIARIAMPKSGASELTKSRYRTKCDVFKKVKVDEWTTIDEYGQEHTNFLINRPNIFKERPRTNPSFLYNLTPSSVSQPLEWSYETVDNLPF